MTQGLSNNRCVFCVNYTPDTLSLELDEIDKITVFLKFAFKWLRQEITQINKQVNKYSHKFCYEGNKEDGEPE